LGGHALPLLSVRGDARLVVPPDYASLSGHLSLTGESKAVVLSTAAAALDQLTADLAELGGTARSAQSERNPLTWSAHATTTHPEYHKDESGHGRTGRIIAAVSVEITVRDLSLLDALGSLLARHEPMQLNDVSWHVDWDNPSWPSVRAAAITAAISKGRDYAAALGGALEEVVHVADSGLLGSGGSSSSYVGAALSGGGRHFDPDAPSLDPVPQEVVAVIEARFTASGVQIGNLAS
jgi:uncharacterized protein